MAQYFYNVFLIIISNKIKKKHAHLLKFWVHIFIFFKSNLFVCGLIIHSLNSLVKGEYTKFLVDLVLWTLIELFPLARKL